MKFVHRLFAKKKKKQVCGNCTLYNKEKGTCRIVVLNEGQKMYVPVDPQDKCFFGDKFTATNSEGEQEEILPADEVKQIRMWAEDPKTGKPANKGIVKIEYPKDLDIKIE